MSDDAAKAKSVFLSAIEEHPPDQWPAFLDGACAEDVALRAQVEKLLRAHLELGTFHEKPGVGAAATIEPPPISERPGQTIGRYKLLEEIGEGGMGVVYLAEQQEPIRRKVALKIIKPGMDTRQVIARFEAERQALALMDHPGIARVLDASATDSGRPYFVMELVHGAPLTEYCDKNQLSIRRRLELFVQICQAVEHAHQKGVIHRDLKPAHLMVTLAMPAERETVRRLPALSPCRARGLSSKRFLPSRQPIWAARHPTTDYDRP
jgi:eukaryotic-like serine/threonine-protein kinase